MILSQDCHLFHLFCPCLSPADAAGKFRRSCRLGLIGRTKCTQNHRATNEQTQKNEYERKKQNKNKEKEIWASLASERSPLIHPLIDHKISQLCTRTEGGASVPLALPLTLTVTLTLTLILILILILTLTLTLINPKPNQNPNPNPNLHPGLIWAPELRHATCTPNHNLNPNP